MLLFNWHDAEVSSPGGKEIDKAVAKDHFRAGNGPLYRTEYVPKFRSIEQQISHNKRLLGSASLKSSKNAGNSHNLIRQI